jgi:signal transduction histidine kinase
LTILLLVSWPVRVAATSLVAFAAWAGYYAHPAQSVATVGARLTGSFMVFIMMLSVAIGHGLFVLLRENFHQRQQLADRERAFTELNEDLQRRVDAQTASLRELSFEREATREADRVALARELHDELGQELLAVRFALALAHDRAAAGQDPQPALASCDALLDRTQASTRRMLATLRPQALDTLGLVKALQQLVDESAHRAGLLARFDAPPSLELPASWANAIYRITQECLTNVAKHAAATQVVVTLQELDEWWLLTVCDDGRGAPEPATSGLGRLGISERALHLGGSAIWSSLAPGTQVTVRLPRSRATEG